MSQLEKLLDFHMTCASYPPRIYCEYTICSGAPGPWLQKNSSNLKHLKLPNSSNYKQPTLNNNWNSQQLTAQTPKQLKQLKIKLVCCGFVTHIWMKILSNRELCGLLCSLMYIMYYILWSAIWNKLLNYCAQMWPIYHDFHFNPLTGSQIMNLMSNPNIR